MSNGTSYIAVYVTDCHQIFLVWEKIKTLGDPDSQPLSQETPINFGMFLQLLNPWCDDRVWGSMEMSEQDN